MLLQSSAGEDHDTILSMETNIDDCTGEALSFTLQQTAQGRCAGCLLYSDLYEENRPAYLLKVLCQPDDRAKMEAIIFHNTTTIGIRFQEMHRTKLDRRIIAVETPWGMADVKCLHLRLRYLLLSGKRQRKTAGSFKRGWIFGNVSE